MPARKKDYYSVYEELGFAGNGERGNETYGDCPFCGKQDKFHVNRTTGQYSCKSGSCAMEGNVYTFLDEFYGSCCETDPGKSLWEKLSRDRSIPIAALKTSGIAWDQEGARWLIPIRNSAGAIVNLRYYRVGASFTDGRPMKEMALPFLEPGLCGAETIEEADTVWIVEGYWDKIALHVMLTDACKKAVVKDPKIAIVAVPGAGIFKEQWVEWFVGKNIIAAYDNDDDGTKGKRRANRRLRDVCDKFEVLQWPGDARPKMDVRDLYIAGVNWEELNGMVGPYKTSGEVENKSDAAVQRDVMQDMPLLSSGARPKFVTVLTVFKQHICMTQDMRDALRIIFAVIMSNQLPGDPLWVHVASPPGGGKTLLLTSCTDCAQVVYRSTLTAATLVSGFKGKRDPSLIPQLIGRTFVLKDFTEVLSMPAVVKQQIYSTLRGAYDGRVERTFGNDVYRQYDGHFSMVTGVTQRIFAESLSELGERFLVFHMASNVGADHREVITAALDGAETTNITKVEIAEAAKSFLEYKIDEWPKVPDEYKRKLISLAQIVSMMRASVEYVVGGSDVLAYRPQHEIGTRPAKQLQKLLISLGAQRWPVRIIEDDWKIVVRTAMDSCIGWNMDAIKVLVETDGCTVKTLSKRAGIPQTTVRTHLESLTLLGVLNAESCPNPAGRGAPVKRYWISQKFREYWSDCGFAITPVGRGESILWEEETVPHPGVGNGKEMKAPKTMARFPSKRFRGLPLRSKNS